MLTSALCRVQRTLDGLIDRGDISSRDLDTRTMDALEGDNPEMCALSVRLCMLPRLELNLCALLLIVHCAVEMFLLDTDLAADLGDDAALAAVDRFAEANFSRITNKSGFLMVRSAAVGRSHIDGSKEAW